MLVYTNIFGIRVPSYGLMIVLGIIFANFWAIRVIKKYQLDINDFILLEAYCMLGAFLGAKLLYLIVSFKYIKWEHIFEYDYFNGIMLGGYVFYGGLLGGVAGVFLGGKNHGINSSIYLRKCVFLVPLIHCFGRVGCFLAGCCYGKPYHGIGSVIFPEGSFAPAGIELFPVQLIEAMTLLLLAVFILLLQFKCRINQTVEVYLIGYGIIRFFLEFFRDDEVRGRIYLSVSQWISIIIVSVVILKMYSRYKENSVFY